MPGPARSARLSAITVDIDHLLVEAANYHIRASGKRGSVTGVTGKCAQGRAICGAPGGRCNTGRELRLAILANPVAAVRNFLLDDVPPRLKPVFHRAELRDFGGLGRDPVNLFFKVFFGEADALQNAFAVLDHVGMTAQIGGGGFSGEAPEVGVFADQVVRAAALAFPGGILPGPAHSGHVGEPRDLRGHLADLFVVAKFPGAAGAVEQVKLVPLRELAFLPVALKSADVADK